MALPKTITINDLTAQAIEARRELDGNQAEALRLHPRKSKTINALYAAVRADLERSYRERAAKIMFQGHEN